MLGIYEALDMIDKIQSNSELHIDALMIANSVHRNFGRLYVRTTLDFVSNIGFYPDNTYISYSVYPDDEVKGIVNKINELQIAADAVLEEQKRDIIEFKKKVLSAFPKAEICVLISPYYCYTFNNCAITGEIWYSEIPTIVNLELKGKYDSELKYLEHNKQNLGRLKQAYQHEIDWIKSMVREEVVNFNKERNSSR